MKIKVGEEYEGSFRPGATSKVVVKDIYHQGKIDWVVVSYGPGEFDEWLFTADDFVKRVNEEVKHFTELVL